MLHFENRVYVIEFKVVELSPKGTHLARIKARGYAEKFAGREVYLLGVEFSSKEKNIIAFEWEFYTVPNAR